MKSPFIHIGWIYIDATNPKPIGRVYMISISQILSIYICMAWGVIFFLILGRIFWGIQVLKWELSFFLSFSNSKLDSLPIKGLFLFILHQNEARVGGWGFLHHKSIASLNIENIIIMDLVLCSTHLVFIEISTRNMYAYQSN